MADPEAVIDECKKHGMEAIVASTPDPADVDKILEIHKEHKNFVLVSLGFHPHIASNYSDAEVEKYIEKIKKNRHDIVAIGEAGLDYNEHDLTEEMKERQKKQFKKFVQLAEEVHLPLVVHIRNSSDNDKNAYADVFSILEKHNLRAVVLHCFSGSETDLKTALDRGYWVSFATNVCKTKKHPRLAAKTPLDRMLLETDAPWLDPDSPIGSHELTNKPWKIERSAEVIAELHKTTKKHVLKITTKNARKILKYSR
jgi:TatD DNase family protein